MTNLEIGKLLKKIAAAYQILDENRFKIIAYERAAESIEHLTSEAKDLWDDGKLDEVPGLGKTLMGHLDELFRTGKVKHFETVLARLPASIYPLLDVPGIGPKKAYKLVTELNLSDEKNVISSLEQAALEHKITPMVGFGEKSEADILAAIKIYRKGALKQNRMLLSEASLIADAILDYLVKSSKIIKVDVLGSLRRQVSTIGDIDIAVATNDPSEVLEYFVKYPHHKIIEKGPTGASILLNNGHQVDLRVAPEDSYGAMLQYFTGSKNHNIRLRTLALKKGQSLSEYGIKNIKTDKTKSFKDETSFYGFLGLDYIEPELREDQGEIIVAEKHQLPDLVDLGDIKGDFHLHTSYDLNSSHDIGVNDLGEYLNQAEQLSYTYIGISDHNPSFSNQSADRIIDIMKRRKEYYEDKYSSYTKNTHKQIKIFIMLEVDITSDGTLALPLKAFDYVDGVIASVHSSFNNDRKTMTERIMKGLMFHPKVRILGHPTGRLLSKREGYELDWDKIFSICKDREIALEINSYPERLDLSDTNVLAATKQGIRMVIDSDSHAVDQMEMMRFGVAVARRGWATKRDIVNTFSYNEVARWLVKGESL